MKGTYVVIEDREKNLFTLGGRKGEAQADQWKDRAKSFRDFPPCSSITGWTLNDRRRGEGKLELSKQIRRSAGRMYFWEANFWWASNVHIVQRCAHINCCKLGLHKALLPDSVAEPSFPCLGFWNMSPGASQCLQQQSPATRKNENLHAYATGVASIRPTLSPAYLEAQSLSTAVVIWFCFRTSLYS